MTEAPSDDPYCASHGQRFDPSVGCPACVAGQPYVGQPATIHLYTDTTAAVVTKVSPKSIVVTRVETGERKPDMAADAGAYGARPVIAEGLVDQPIEGADTRFRLNPTTGRYANGSIGLSLGRSVTRIDYRF